MKNIILLKTLRALIYSKRVLWWLGSGFGRVLGVIFIPVHRVFGWGHYKIGYFFKRTGLTSSGAWWLRRSVMQMAVFVVVIVLAMPQTKLYAKRDISTVGQDSLAFRLTSPEEKFSTEDIIVVSDNFTPDVNRQAGVVEAEMFLPGNVFDAWQDQELSAIVAGGTAFGKPILLPGGHSLANSTRTEPVEYIIEAGDNLGSIANRFGVSLATILWENKLTERSILRLGQKIIILPVTGVTHKVVKGDVVSKLAKTYRTEETKIIEFNKLEENGGGLVAGNFIIIPDGVKPASAVPASARITPTVGNVTRPPASAAAPTASGFVWPAGVRVITQYYNWNHHAIDIAGGNFKTPIYASKAGTVVVSQCGWNGGYGCYVTLDHGGGVRTIYGHNSKLLVSVGDYVGTGETIALMGNTGNVRGKTGIHLHFEVLVNGVRKNPLSYVK
ncbi:MAG: hypothetical protein A3J93_05180 [Candidatus Magasanikbacteria bacterium RIFOXYC2_FULL_42_28]|uniref:LysM domain-containing protein n=1 Tax=Candidatus Magasanikbacteria bacterium RIFOXYC2_FULL_42_28 TaxID=1798704 RepID=A0A1F6NV42_9BACT|nr:MAG: hypothetical protein A3J93_05180 [Candidatus Magasanikbacteria bacterium RIFOXYC2_FULL_42_28]